jgi:hypothetical protein
MNKSKFDEEISIDRYNLVEEILKQPQRYMEWASKVTAAEIETEMAKHKVKIIESKIFNKIKLNPSKLDLTQVTDTLAKNETAKHPKVKRAFRNYLTALREEKDLKRAEIAFRQRKAMLQSLVQLNLQLHFAEVNIPSHSGEQVELNRRTRSNISRRLKRRRNKK